MHRGEASEIGRISDSGQRARTAREDENMTDAGAGARGYDPGFLAAEAPLPRPTTRGPVRELDYPRFTVLLDPRRRLARVTGVNVDGATLRDLPREGGWRLDDRIPASEQTGPDLYARNDLDRGHLVRRRDPGWGTRSEARAAMAATFVYPNAAPQASAFNQSKDLWLGLEDHLLEFAEATDQRISAFTAPVLSDDDPVYRGVGIPRRFWKIVAWADASIDGRLSAAGFVLDQSELLDVREGALTVAPLGGFRTFQVPIADIERLAGLDAEALVEADVVPQTTLRGEAGWRPLRTDDDIVLG